MQVHSGRLSSIIISDCYAIMVLKTLIFQLGTRIRQQLDPSFKEATPDAKNSPRKCKKSSDVSFYDHQEMYVNCLLFFYVLSFNRFSQIILLSILYIYLINM